MLRRHFGGVKLGAGGLARAYGGAARDCVRAAPKAFVKAQVRPGACAERSGRCDALLDSRLKACVHARQFFWPVLLQVQLHVRTPFECLGSVYALLGRFGNASAGAEEYVGARVELLLTVDAEQAEQLAGAIVDATSGRVRPRVVVAEVD